MAYIGNIPAEQFTSVDIQNFTVSATANYTLDRPVANENEIELFINNVRQHPGSGKAYTASGTALTLSEATAGTDTMYCVYQGKARQTVTPATSSVTNDMLAGSIDLTSKVTGALPQANIADEAINEAKMQISNAPTNGYMLTAQSGNTGGLTWAEAGSGAMELLSTASRTSGSASQVYMTDFMDNTKYISYIAHVSFKNSGNGNSQFFNFTSSGGTTMEASNYYGAGNSVKNASGSVSNNTIENSTNSNRVTWVTNVSTRTDFMEFVMHPIGVTTDSGVSTVFYRGQTDRWTGSAREPQYVTGAAYYINSTVPTGFVIGAVGGNWDRYEIRVYGLKKA